MSYDYEVKTPMGVRLSSPEGFGLFDVKRMQIFKELLKAVFDTMQITGDGITENTTAEGENKDKSHFALKCKVPLVPSVNGKFEDSSEKQCVHDIATILADLINSLNITMDLSNLHVQSSDSGESIDTLLKLYLKIEDLQKEIDKLDRYAIQEKVDSAIEEITERLDTFLNENTQEHENFSQQIQALETSLDKLKTDNTNALKTLTNKLKNIEDILPIINQTAEQTEINTTDITNLNTTETNLGKKVTNLETRVTKCEVDIQTLFQYADDGKNLIAVAITGKGVPASKTDTFQVLANKISQIETGGGSSGSVDLSKLKLTSREYSQADPETNICFNNNGTWKKMTKFMGKGCLYFEEIGAMGRDCCEPDFEGEGSFRVIIDDTKYISIGDGDSVSFEKSLEIQCTYSLASHSCWIGDNDPVFTYWIGVLTLLT